MNLLCFKLGQLSAESNDLIDAWTRRLQAKSGRIAISTSTMWADAIRAVWRGEPFLVAAEPFVLDRYLNQLGPDELEVLADCAYFWVLTSSGEYHHQHLPKARLTALSWRIESHNIVVVALETLNLFPEMKGLSSATDEVRKRIRKISRGLTGPGCSVLILGPTGSGKERVAQALAAAAHSESRKQMQAISGAWLNMEPGMAMTELVGLGRGPFDERIPGLLLSFTKNTLFIDDFESCPRNIQETLLRVMSVPEGEKGRFRAVGAREESETGVWLVFATNHDVSRESFVRQDFFYRFGARIIRLFSIEKRPADFPAIAHAIWNDAWDSRLKVDQDEKRREPLRTAALKHLYSLELEMEGNVRTLATLLKLVVAEMCEPHMNGWSQSDILDRITANGPSILDWISAWSAKREVPVEPVQEPTALEPQSPVVQNTGAATESELKSALSSVLQPHGAKMLDELERRLLERVDEANRPVNTPGRHLFYAALLYLAGRQLPAGSTALKEALGISKGHVQSLCSEMTELFQEAPMSELCQASRDSRKHFSFSMPRSVLRSGSVAQ